MTDLNDIRSLTNMIVTLEAINTASTDKVASVRSLIAQIEANIDAAVSGSLKLTSRIINGLQQSVNELLSNSGEINVNENITTVATVETFQLNGDTSDTSFVFNEDSIIPPEHGTIIQKLWAIKFTDDTVGHCIISDTSDTELSTLFTAQLSTVLTDAPAGAVEDLDVTISLSDLQSLVSSRDLTSVMTNLEKPGLVARQIRDIDITTDPTMIGLNMTSQQIDDLNAAIVARNAATTEEDINTTQAALQTQAESVGLFSTSIGPVANLEYSDLKRFNLDKGNGDIVSVTASMPVVSWGAPVAGIPLRNESADKNKDNRKDEGTSYIVDMGGLDMAIRRGKPNPLPPTRFYNTGPNYATDTEGALDRYAGGKCLGLNTTSNVATFTTVHYEADGEIEITLQPLTALWMLDRATFDLSNRHAYYTVFSASRAPASGFMGVALAPKQGRLGRGRGEVASGVTLANGISKTGLTFNVQDENGPILTDGLEVDSGLTGLTCDYDGHGYAPADLLAFLEANSFTKGTQYLTIPADATVETVQDVLIPAGQFVPQITQAVGTLMQFQNGKYIRDGGPNRFQAGLIPFLPGTRAYTPEWHINWIFYNCGIAECDGREYTVENVAQDTSNEEWTRPNQNVSVGAPGPNPANSEDSGYSPAFPVTFDPVQMRCDMKAIPCLDFVKAIPGSINGEISLTMLPGLEDDNKIFVTDAPAGAMRGWVKYLVVNCPLPIIVNIAVTQNTSNVVVPEVDEGNCTSCTCDRTATSLSINGDLNPIWLDEDVEGNDSAIGDRVLKFKVGDNVVIRATAGTMHGVSLRMDNMTTHTAIDNDKTLAQMQSEVLTELSTMLTINNPDDLENNIAAMSDDLITLHGGIPITFTKKATVNPVALPDGVVIADFTVLAGTGGETGTVGCTVHGSSMSFQFTICPEA